MNNNTEGQQNNTSTAAPSFKSDESRRANVAKIEAMAAQISTLFVRKDNKFFAVDNLNVRLSKDDVERACINLFASMEGDDLNLEVLKGALNLAIVQKAVNPRFTIPVWNGQVVCAAGNNERLVRKKGMVAVNVWIKPSYRDRNVPADFGVATEFLEWIFPIPAERTKILDWVAWNLQNESDKPSWAPLLYSEEKGTGKSTFCELIAALMGKENSVTQNNVKKLAARFNMTALQSKLVISEELQLRSDGAEANALKTYLTEGDALAERKGQEAVRITQCCAFLFTTNHLPTWIEAGDRRFYVVEVKHDGHASGSQSEAFGQIVSRLKAAMEDEDLLAAIYGSLMAHEVSAEFSAKHFNPKGEATEIMTRLQGSGARVIAETLTERLADKGIRAIRQDTLFDYATRELRVNPEMLRHLLPEMKLNKQMVKWGGKDYVRVIWVTEGSRVERGVVHFENGGSQDLVEHLQIDLNSGFAAVACNA